MATSAASKARASARATRIRTTCCWFSRDRPGRDREHRGLPRGPRVTTRCASDRARPRSARPRAGPPWRDRRGTGRSRRSRASRCSLGAADRCPRRRGSARSTSSTGADVESAVAGSAPACAAASSARRAALFSTRRDRLALGRGAALEREQQRQRHLALAQVRVRRACRARPRRPRSRARRRAAGRRARARGRNSASRRRSARVTPPRIEPASQAADEQHGALALDHRVVVGLGDARDRSCARAGAARPPPSSGSWSAKIQRMSRSPSSTIIDEARA